MDHRQPSLSSPIIPQRIASVCQLTTLCGLLVLATALNAGETVNFSRDVRPILSSKCFKCHGPDEDNREGGFRLDEKESAFGEADSGERPIVPGDTSASELIARIVTDDVDLLMPPADSTKELTDEEIATLQRWVEEGANWQEHWAFIPPELAEVPTVTSPDWPRNAIDHFILARLDEAGLAPSKPADKRTLIRRVTFDLTGLPPTLAEIDAFLADTDEGAYERLVDRLLDKTEYGEHMARFWLDAARYGDTHGLHLDNYREMWPYRDWVVQAFNSNLPYDQFTIEQLAGDLLPDATLDQQVASGFNRCHVTTNEGGSIEEEVYVRNVVDRVVTTGTVFMGMTLDCTRCHDHKYDPFTMKEFYSLFAFFNSIDGKPMDGNAAQHAPVVRVPTAEQKTQLAELDDKIDAVRREIKEAVATVDYDPSKDADVPPTVRSEFVWIDDEAPAAAKSVAEGNADGKWTLVSDPEPVFRGEFSSKRTASGRSQHFFEGANASLRVGAGDKLFTYVYLDPEDPPAEIMLQWNTGNWRHRAFWGENLIDWGKDGTSERKHLGGLPAAGRWLRLEVDVADVGIEPGAEINGWAFAQHGGTVYWDYAGIITKTPQLKSPFKSLKQWLAIQQAGDGKGLPKDIKEIAKRGFDSCTIGEQKKLRDYFVENAFAETRALFEPLHKRRSELQKQKEVVNKKVASTLVFKERAEPKPAYMLNRGEYDQPGEQVLRALPAFLPGLPEGAPLNRLGLAQWLVDENHPLTARVAVNRFWQQIMGTGLVKTSDDFGSQGEPPSHPELLDWLASQLIADGWDVKETIKRIVMSATYQQSSHFTPESMSKDPENRLLARGPRFRLDAEMLRDQALAISGLLVNKLGGPSVKPPQPDGLWFAVGYSGSNTVRFKADEGPDKVHRRALYTFVKRTSPPPQMSTFDGPSRESCSVRRERTNTPLQALLLMNDPQFVEAARSLARRVFQHSAEQEARAKYMFRLCTAREPSAMELNELLAVYEAHLQEYENDTDAANKLISSGTESESESPASLAAWTMVANLMLNLDEVVTKN